jgi:hypothetical protein
VRYELNFSILFKIKLVFEGLKHSGNYMPLLKYSELHIQNAGIIPPISVNLLLVAMVMQCIFFEVGTGF